MKDNEHLRCDGCGQLASAEHTARRLRRLEWATRYRPVHLRMLLLGAVSPRVDGEFLYSPDGEFQGEAGALLHAVGIPTKNRPAEAVQAEFQAAGLFVAHILECPIDEVDPLADGQPDLGRRRKPAATNETELLRERLPFVASRIRRSLKPKHVILVTETLEPVVQDILTLGLGCPVLLNDARPFDFSAPGGEDESLRLRDALAGLGGA